MPGGLGKRFAVETAFIVAVAVFTIVASFSWQAILLTMLCAWALIALVEWVTSRRRPAVVEPSTGAVEAAKTAAPPQSLERLQRTPAQAAPLERPRVRVLAPEPEEPVRPPLVAVPTPRPPEPVPPPLPSEPFVVPLASVDTRPREWNLWELERAVRGSPAADPERDDERNYLLLYLREFANSNGALPVDFDPLVRDSFGDVLAAVQPQ